MTLTIGRVAARSGFSTSTLRYYDDVGLVRPSVRNDASYRIYDAGVFDRLAFVSRAKELGCTIEEIRELLVAWDGGRCGPVQDRLRRLVAEKIDATAGRIALAELLLAELRRSADDLERHRPVGACDESCGCASAPPQTMPVDVELASKADIACTLEADLLGDRLADWQTLLASGRRRERLPDGIRLTFAPTVRHDELMRLVAAEHSCCAFFRFAITVDGRGVALEVRADPEGLEVVERLFGEPSAGLGDE